MDKQTVNLTPRGVYAYGLVLAYLRTSPSAIVERVDEHGLQRALDVNGGIVIRVERAELFASPDPVRMTVWGEDLTPHRLDSVAAYVRRLLFLDVDGQSIEEYLLARDPALGHYIRQYRGFRPILLASPWEALLWAVAGQLIGVEQARVVKRRLVEQIGYAISVGDVAWPLPPQPKQILASGVDALRATGLSRAKAAAIHQAAHAVESGILDLRPDQSLGAITSNLTTLQSIPGIGPWTTAMVALRGFGDINALPAGDAGLQSIVAHHSHPSGIRLSSDALQQRAAVWAPYRGWAAYLWWLQLQAEALARRAEQAIGDHPPRG